MLHSLKYRLLDSLKFRNLRHLDKDFHQLDHLVTLLSLLLQTKKLQLATDQSKWLTTLQDKRLSIRHPSSLVITRQTLLHLLTKELSLALLILMNSESLRSSLVLDYKLPSHPILNQRLLFKSETVLVKWVHKFNSLFNWLNKTDLILIQFTLALSLRSNSLLNVSSSLTRLSTPLALLLLLSHSCLLWKLTDSKNLLLHRRNS